MNTNPRIALINDDYRQRASIVYSMGRHGVYIEPFESVNELLASSWDGSLIMAQDKDHCIEELADRFCMKKRALPIIAFGEEPRVRDVVEAMRHGASDYLSWPATETEIFNAIATVQEGAKPQEQTKRRANEAHDRVSRLTRREREVLLGVARGSTNRQIAEELGISPRTVEIHRANMLAKLQASNSPEAVRIASDAGLLN